MRVFGNGLVRRLIVWDCFGILAFVSRWWHPHDTARVQHTNRETSLVMRTPTRRANMSRAEEVFDRVSAAVVRE